MDKKYPLFPIIDVSSGYRLSGFEKTKNVLEFQPLEKGFLFIILATMDSWMKICIMIDIFYRICIDLVVDFFVNI